MKNSSVYRVKLISLGNAETGKSCLIKRYCEKRFVNKYMTTIGIDFGVTRVDIAGKTLKVNIFDMGGHSLFYEIRNEFYGDTQGCILVYDISDMNSFRALDSWLHELTTELGGASELARLVVVVCGTKSDKPRAVPESDGRLWAETHGFQFRETSAQTGAGVNELFKGLFEGVVQLLETGSRPNITTTLGYTKEQADAITHLKHARSDNDRLRVSKDATKDEVNKAYRRLAVLLHPDKSVAPGAEEAFKILCSARQTLLRYAKE